MLHEDKMADREATQKSIPMCKSPTP